MPSEREGIVVIGGGKMGGAIVEGWVRSQEAPADTLGVGDIVVVEPGADRRGQLAREVGIACVSSADQVRHAPKMVVLAVKPQVMAGVLAGLAELPAFSGAQGGPLFVSIAAGLTTAAIEASLPAGAQLVRVMPNMPLSIGAGASGVCGGSRATDGQVRYVAELFGCLGKAVVVDEGDMDVVCALSGSGPAYVAAMVEALRDAAASEGLDAVLAETLAVQTVLGTARLIDRSDLSVAEIRESICSPGGTTIAALEAMNAAGFAGVFDAGVRAAVSRSKELAECI